MPRVKGWVIDSEIGDMAIIRKVSLYRTIIVMGISIYALAVYDH